MQVVRQIRAGRKTTGTPPPKKNNLQWRYTDVCLWTPNTSKLEACRLQYQKTTPGTSQINLSLSFAKFWFDVFNGVSILMGHFT